MNQIGSDSDAVVSYVSVYTFSLSLCCVQCAWNVYQLQAQPKQSFRVTWNKLEIDCLPTTERKM